MACLTGCYFYSIDEVGVGVEFLRGRIPKIDQSSRGVRGKGPVSETPVAALHIASVSSCPVYFDGRFLALIGLCCIMALLIRAGIYLCSTINIEIFAPASAPASAAFCSSLRTT